MRLRSLVVAAAMVGSLVGGSAVAQEPPPTGIPVVWAPGATLGAVPGVGVISASVPAVLINTDPLGPHDADAVDLAPNGRPLFETDVIGAGGIAQFVINGTLATGSMYAYRCTVHANMTGTMIAL